MSMTGALQAPWPGRYFLREELVCKCGNCDGGDEAYLREMAVELDKVRDAYGKPMRLTSAYRCLKHSAEAAKRPESLHPHTYLHAVDVSCRSSDAQDLIVAALLSGWGGIGVSQRSSRFIHIDRRWSGSRHPVSGVPLRRAIWSYA